ncbi:hypothetical protein BAUCODRAFT_126574 [Baudoinia panamericana UAMH 10762]|uniref:Uncharacterized protein n=1 Tax=Baudoinia panamericana (strain UAMH 10762) TaxID=717646 RepID=M2MJS3_BAUPA|nr:uncharacterized protein BAUCODRAFT_126574 [Baudoinia panamericana UAMH 10762]EMC91573.1 hypothetical protein BAUCODRAFT_126574 [Baudoinia panamericana UAMH 10762]
MATAVIRLAKTDSSGAGLSCHPFLACRALFDDLAEMQCFDGERQISIVKTTLLRVDATNAMVHQLSFLQSRVRVPNSAAFGSEAFFSPHPFQLHNLQNPL